jgi:hypothetical protein
VREQAAVLQEQAAVLQVLVQELLAEWAEEVALPQLVVV